MVGCVYVVYYLDALTALSCLLPPLSHSLCRAVSLCVGQTSPRHDDVQSNMANILHSLDDLDAHFVGKTTAHIMIRSSEYSYADILHIIGKLDLLGISQHKFRISIPSTHQHIMQPFVE